MPSFYFKGKAFLQNYHHSVKFHKLDSVSGKGTSKKPNLNDNLLIHGDNLKALKALLPTHAGKVQCIYIDPPYNIGNEGWVYNDNVASPTIQEWLGKAVGMDDLARHDKWCCMMYPRLVFLRELLAEDGVIFVSIDDNEVHHLRMMLDEVFGAENFVNSVIWEKKFAPQNDAKWFSDNHDFLLVYAKNKDLWRPNLFERSEEANARYTNPDDDPRGDWTSGDLSVKTYTPTCDYEITTPSGRIVNPPKGSCWRVSKEAFAELLADNRIWFGAKGDNVPRLKRFLSEVKQGITPLTIWKRDQVGDTQEARREIREIFGDVAAFDTPKPTRLIKQVLYLALKDKNAIVLDSFAGSGTTAHAVLALNQEDGGNRKFILVECEDYADKITGERIRRVIRGLLDAKDEALQKGLGGSFSYYELGEELEMDKILEGTDLPSYEELARYAFFTATGENWDESKMEVDEYYIGSSNTFEVYMLYAPKKEKLKELALNLDFAIKVQNRFPNKQKLVFAPACFMEEYHLKEYGIRFAQLPFEIYRMAE